MTRRNAILIFGILAIIAVIAVVAAADQNDRGTRAGETYVGSEECNSCKHGTSTKEYLNWSETAHGIDFSNWDYHGVPTNKYTYGGGNDTTGMTGSCTPCHVVGYDQTDIGGFDPALPWNDTYNLPLLRIGCENCHGPGSAHIGSTSPSDINLGLDRYAESCLGTEDAECHSGYRQGGNESIGGWTQSVHGPADDIADPESEEGSLNKYCARCKDPSNFVEGASRDDSYDISEFRGITCGDCHDLHPDPANTHEYQLRWDVEETCDACHNGGHHETMRTTELSGEPSVNRTDYPYMDEVSCVECHMWSSPRDLRGTEYEHQGHDFSATIDACLECHSTIFEDIPDTDDTVNWTAWEEDYAEVYEEWEHVVEAAQERHEDLIFIIEGDETTDGLLDEVEELMEVAEDNGTWTDHLEELFEQAEFDYELAEHNSHGAHNPAYGIALLNAAIDGFEEIIEELEMGTVKGWVTDKNDAAVADAYINVNGHGMKTDSDGMYMLMVEPGTYDVSAFIMGTEEKIAADVVIHSAAVVVQNFTLAPDFDGDGTADTTDTDDEGDGVAEKADDYP
ncbi:MAG: hypothetical protein JSV09_02200 [Thermoplasmata archaeon]|nr:MAG: hypothetical protein JSV09_02200 [Thermoplasmata archaeon]